MEKNPQYGQQQQYGQQPQYGQPPQAVYSTGQSQPNVVIVANQQPRPSFTGHIILSCFVFWCCGCGCICGLIAFVLAMIGKDKNAVEAQPYGKASLALSIAGIVITIIIVIILLIMYFTGALILHHQYSISMDHYASSTRGYGG